MEANLLQTDRNGTPISERTRTEIRVSFFILALSTGLC